MPNIVVQTSTQTQFPAGGDVTFAQMKSDVAAYYGMDGDPIKEALAGRAVRDAIDDLNRKQVWNFNLVESAAIPTQATVATVALPTDFWKTYNARKSDSIDYTLTTLQQGVQDRMFQSQANITGFPYVFTIRNTFRDGTVQLFPVPDGVYQIKIRYFKLIVRPSADSDVLDMPQPYQGVPKYGALARFGALNQQPENVRYWQTMFEQGVSEMSKTDENTGDDDLRWVNIEEFYARGLSYVSPNIRPRAFDFF